MDAPDMPLQASAPGITDAQIREVFIAAGFTIKPGETDLRPYVYKAARDLLALAASQQASLTALKAAIVPRTELGRELLRLRHAYIAGGGRLLSGDALDATGARV